MSLGSNLRSLTAAARETFAGMRPLVCPARAHSRKGWPQLALLCGLFALNALAARPSYRADPTYLIDTWETEDGLPGNSATAVVQTPDGYLWFGTFDGLVRFDGVKFKVLTPANTPQLPSAGIVNLHLDRGAAACGSALIAAWPVWTWTAPAGKR